MHLIAQESCIGSQFGEQRVLTFSSFVGHLTKRSRNDQFFVRLKKYLSQVFQLINIPKGIFFNKKLFVTKKTIGFFNKDFINSKQKIKHIFKSKKQIKRYFDCNFKRLDNTVSILVFNDWCIPFWINKEPSKIDVNQIRFPSGGTTRDPTFLKAADIITEIYTKQQKNFKFFYISDGFATHPSQGIKQLLDSKGNVNAKIKNLDLLFYKILIGKCSQGTIFMKNIQNQLGGLSVFVQNPSELANQIKEILVK